MSKGMGIFNNLFGKTKDAKFLAKMTLQYATNGNKSEADYWYEQAADQGNSDGLRNMADNKKDLLLKRIRKPENETIEEWAMKNDELYYEAEQNYYNALNASETDVMYSVTCYSLANLYESFCEIYPDIEKAAYYYYEAYRSGGNNFALDRFNKIKVKYQLNVDPSDMDKWAKKLQIKE